MLTLTPTDPRFADLDTPREGMFTVIKCKNVEALAAINVCAEPRDTLSFDNPLKIWRPGGEYRDMSFNNFEFRYCVPVVETLPPNPTLLDLSRFHDPSRRIAMDEVRAIFEMNLRDADRIADFLFEKEDMTSYLRLRHGRTKRANDFIHAYRAGRILLCDLKQKSITF